MVNIAVCDDEIFFLENTKSQIEKYLNEKNLQGTICLFDNGDSFLDAMKNQVFDIVLLDVMMPLLNGIETATELRETNITTKIIFVTSSSEYAVDSYSVKASNYLLKPVKYEQMRSALEECIVMISKTPKSITIKTQNCYQKIKLDEIEYFEAQNKTVILYLSSGGSQVTFETLNFFENQLSAEPEFIKCHRSYIVNINNIRQFSATDIETTCKRHIPLSRNCASRFKNAYIKTVFE